MGVKSQAWLKDSNPRMQPSSRVKALEPRHALQVRGAVFVELLLLYPPIPPP
jgi:hypothetical protein